MLPLVVALLCVVSDVDAAAVIENGKRSASACALISRASENETVSADAVVAMASVSARPAGLEALR